MIEEGNYKYKCIKLITNNINNNINNICNIC
jgi:hypothetical protein